MGGGDDGAVLLTGATGFVGMEVLVRYLERDARPIVALVRAQDDAAAQQRLRGVLENLFGGRAAAHAPRVTALASDLTAPRLGLTDGVWERLAGQVSTIVHGAASVSFTLPLHEARRINVEGTRRVLDFAEQAVQRGGLRQYAHISTAYVAGTHRGRFCERDLDLGQSFHNSYEQSKFEAERLVRDRNTLPRRILRPSIIVGDRQSGWTAAFNVLYWPLRALSRGLFAAVPAVDSAPVDVVSVDYVADAIHALCEQPIGPGTPCQTHHLTAWPNASTMGEITGLASRYFRRPAPRVLPPADFARLAPDSVARASALAAGSVYFPYFSIETVFDSAETQAALAATDIRPSPLTDYLERLLDFATRSRWGKRPISRVQARMT
jgi:thioester reductase-like protein